MWNTSTSIRTATSYWFSRHHARLKALPPRPIAVARVVVEAMTMIQLGARITTAIVVTNKTRTTTPRKKSVEILVSSYAVITASTVFKSMLQGPFKEGSDIAEARKSRFFTFLHTLVFIANMLTSSDGVVYRLALPEDNADATLLFCKIVHFKSDISTPNLELMEQLAVLCDKYKCHHILRFLGSMWLNEHRRNLQLESSRSRTCQQLGRLFIFAYVADMAQEFNELAWELLLHNTGGINSYNSCVLFLIDHPLVPKKVISKIIPYISSHQSLQKYEVPANQLYLTSEQKLTLTSGAHK